VSDRIFVTGVGVVSPVGDSPEGFRDALLGGASGIAVDDRFTGADCRSRLTARVSGFDAAKWISPMKLRRMDTTGPYALVAMRQAMDAAHYAVRTTGDGDDRTGVVLGSYSAGGQATNEYLGALFDGGPTGAPALLFNSTVGNAAAGLAGLEYKLRGPNATVSQKEASGLAAIAIAVDLLRLGRADAVGAGGMDAIYDLFFRAHDRFSVMNDAASVDHSIAPFDRCRRGFVMGEGGFVVWLERGEAWRDRGAQPLAEVLGVGRASATCPVNCWPEDPGPLVHTIRVALEDAGVRAEEIDTIYASANASRGLDAVEARALTTVFRGTQAVVTATKGALGECGASGADACAAAILCGNTGRVPGIACLREADALIESLHVARSTVEARGPLALINSVASGGALCAAVLRIPTLI
jgi:3-oxoacyl-[acyl-carrier-protein] synthase II